MAFIFSTSHLPETRVRRPDHLEDEEDEPSAARQTAAGSPKGERSESTRMQPMPRAGGVRAFSHLPQPVRAQAYFSDPLSTRPATPVGRPRPHTEPDDDKDTDLAPESDYEDDRPWHMPRITAQHLPPQTHDENVDAPEPRSASARPWEKPVRDTGFGATGPADRSASRYQATSSSHEPQASHDDFHSPEQGSTPFQNDSFSMSHERLPARPQPPGWQADLDSTSSETPQRHLDSEYGASGKPPSLVQHTASSDATFESPASTNNVSGQQQQEPISQHGGMRRGQSADRGSHRSGMNRGGTSSPRRLCQQAAPKSSRPKGQGYFVYPRNENVVILYNKKAVGNSFFRHSNGTTMEQQALRMLQDYSGSTTNPRLIDISNPGWVRKLDALAAANKDKGGFTHLVILDHGVPGGQHLGVQSSYETKSLLTPDSAAWRIISSVMAPEGHIHLGGCYVGKDERGQNYLNDLFRSLGQGSKITIDAVTGSMLNLSNVFEGDLIRAQPTQPHPLP